jgi:hypothetical protein
MDSNTAACECDACLAILFCCLLFLSNLFSFLIRTIAAIIIEHRFDWRRSDVQLGLIGTAFTQSSMGAGVPLEGSAWRIIGARRRSWAGAQAV